MSNIILIVLKFIAGVMTASSAMIVDAVHSLSDVFTDIAIYIALQFSIKSPDDDHPYGHGKIENITAVIVGVLLIQIGIFFIYNGVKSVVIGDIAKVHGNFGLYAAGLSIVIKEVLYHITKRFGKKIKSEALIANAWHHRSDAFSSVVALVGIAASLLGFVYGDIIAGAIIAVILISIGLRIIKKNGNILIEASVDKEIVEAVKQVIENTSGVLSYTDLRLRWSGDKIFGEVIIKVGGSQSVTAGHNISQKLERSIAKKVDDIGSISVHIEPK